MVLFDHRVFRFDNEWWAAQVHSASGAGYSDTPAMTSERVLFSSLTNRDRNTVTARIPVGWLNRLNYRSLTRVLQGGQDYGHHFKMSAYNAPSSEELGAPDFTDSEGLRWVIRPDRIVQVTEGGPAVVDACEFVCLDDSALRKDVALLGRTLDELKAGPNDALRAEIVLRLKGTFEEFEPGQL